MVRKNFHIPSVIRYVRGKYTREDRDTACILKNIRPYVSTTTYQEVHRALVLGAPTVLFGSSSKEKFLDYWRYGNHASVLLNPEKTEKVMAKEDKMIDDKGKQTTYRSGIGRLLFGQIFKTRH